MPASEGTSAGRRGLLAVEVTARCNRRCRYCYNEWRDRDAAPEDLPADELLAVVEAALEATGRRAIQISGGEPLLRSDLFAIIEALRRPGRTISLVTDGGLLDEHAVGELVRLGVAPVQPTLLAARREVHDTLKGAAAFDRTVDAIARLRKAGVPVSVSFVCTSQNYMYFREVVELCFALGVETVAFSRFCSAGAGATRHDELAPGPDMIRACLEVAEEATARLAMKVPIAISLPRCLPEPGRYPHLAFGRCALGSELPSYTVDPRGRLRACSVSQEVLGDLRSEPWETIAARAREGFFHEAAALPKACGGCPDARACGGGCRESARGATGGLDPPDPLARPRHRRRRSP